MAGPVPAIRIRRSAVLLNTGITGTRPVMTCEVTFPADARRG
jgi:hypothetical protein